MYAPRHLPVQSLEDVTANFEQLIAPVSSIPVLLAGTTLPSNAADGESVYFVASATNGVVWEFRYREASTSTHKWEFVGGAALSTAAEGNITTESTAPVALTAGPTLALPLAGDYEISLYMYMQAAAEGLNELHGKIAVAGLGEFEFLREVVRQTFDGGYSFALQRVNGASKANVTVKVVNNSAVKANYQAAILTARPVRVG